MNDGVSVRMGITCMVVASKCSGALVSVVLGSVHVISVGIVDICTVILGTWFRIMIIVVFDNFVTVALCTWRVRIVFVVGIDGVCTVALNSVDLVLI